MQTSAPKLRLAQSGPGHIHITIMADLQYSSTLVDLLEHQPTRLLLLLFYMAIIQDNVWPSVLWHCWLGISKSIWHVKYLSDEVLAWLSVWSEVRFS